MADKIQRISVPEHEKPIEPGRNPFMKSIGQWRRLYCILVAVLLTAVPASTRYKPETGNIKYYQRAYKKIKKGMSEREVRLLLGKPNKISLGYVDALTEKGQVALRIRQYDYLFPSRGRVQFLWIGRQVQRTYRVRIRFFNGKVLDKRGDLDCNGGGLLNPSFFTILALWMKS